MPSFFPEIFKKPLLKNPRDFKEFKGSIRKVTFIEQKKGMKIQVHRQWLPVWSFGVEYFLFLFSIGFSSQNRGGPGLNGKNQARGCVKIWKWGCRPSLEAKPLTLGGIAVEVKSGVGHSEV